MRIILALTLILTFLQASAQEVVIVLRKGSMVVDGDTLKPASGKIILKERSRLNMGTTGSGYAYIKGRNNMLELLPKQRWSRQRLIPAIQASDISLSTRFANLLLSKDLEGNTASRSPNYGGLSRGGLSESCHPTNGDTLIGDTVCMGLDCLNGTAAYMALILNETDTLFAGTPPNESPCFRIEGSGTASWKVLFRNGSTGHAGYFYHGDKVFTQPRMDTIVRLRNETSKLDADLQEEMENEFLRQQRWILR